MVASSAATRKAKGRVLQNWVKDKLIQELHFDPLDTRSTPMGVNGSDVIFNSTDRLRFPYSVECKNQETARLWEWWDQALAQCKNSEALIPLVIAKKNGKRPLAIIDAEYFILMHKEKNNGAD